MSAQFDEINARNDEIAEIIKQLKEEEHARRSESGKAIWRDPRHRLNQRIAHLLATNAWKTPDARENHRKGIEAAKLKPEYHEGHMRGAKARVAKLRALPPEEKEERRQLKSTVIAPKIWAARRAHGTDKPTQEQKDKISESHLRSDRHKKSPTGRRGVRIRDGKFEARIAYGGRGARAINLGRFDTLEEASAAYEAARSAILAGRAEEARSMVVRADPTPEELLAKALKIWDSRRRNGTDRGYKATPETRAKMSESHKVAFAAKAPEERRAIALKIWAARRANGHGGKTGIVGVTLSHGRFATAIWHGGRTKHLGTFDTAEEAAACYEAAARSIEKEGR
jgi:hypothetical protein